MCVRGGDAVQVHFEPFQQNSVRIRLCFANSEAGTWFGVFVNFQEVGMVLLFWFTYRQCWTLQHAQKVQGSICAPTHGDMLIVVKGSN